MSDDTIYRQSAIDAVGINTWAGQRLLKVPSAQPEYRLDEWCTDCKEYDHERRCCPRFNHVIRTTLQEVQAEQPGIIRCKDCLMHGVCRFETGLGLDGYCSQAERREEDG